MRTRHVSTTIRNRPTTRWLYTRATAHIVTAGEALRRQLARDNGDPSRAHDVDSHRHRPRPFRSRRRAPRAPASGLPERPTLGIVATLRDWKGHDDLFDALARDRAGWREWNVIVVGDGPHRPQLDRHLAALDLADRIRFVGQQDDVVPWLQALDLFVLPSWGEEGVPQAIMQAMACGIAVVSTTTGAITEAVDDRRDGPYRARRATSRRSARRLRRCATIPRCAAASALRAAHARSRDFGAARMLDRMEAVFRAVLAER